MVRITHYYANKASQDLDNGSERMPFAELGVELKEIAVDDGRQLTSAQLHQVAQLQPRRR